MNDSAQDDSGTPQIENGLIFLKCRGCKAPTLFKLTIRHEAEATEFTANTHCTSCLEDDPLQGVFVRRLEPKLVDNQRIDSPTDSCHEPNGGESNV